MENRDLPSGIVGAFVLLVGLVGCLLWASLAVGAWRVAGGLTATRSHLDRAEKRLGEGSLKEGRYETLSAAAEAERARIGLAQGAPLFDIARGLPKVGPLAGEVDHFVNAAGLSSHAAVGILDVAQNALQGPQQIIVKDKDDPEGGSRIRLLRIHEIGDTITSIRADFRGVIEELESIDVDNLPRRLRPDVEEGIDRAEEADALFADAEAGFEILPKFLGSRRPRTYLIAMQNSAELRGTGGAILRFAALTIDRGRPEFNEEVRGSVYAFDKNRRPLDIELPEDAWYQGIEDARRFGNAAWSPHWPLAASLTVQYLDASDERVKSRDVPPIDGVIAVDPVTMTELLPAAGSFKLKSGNLINEDSVVFFLLQKAYGSYPLPGVRRKVLEDLVDRFYARILDPEQPSELVKGMGRALGRKHMQIWLVEPDEQAFVERMNWDGGLEPVEDSDFLAVVQQNVGGNKLDYFASMTTDVDISLSDTDADVATKVTIGNDVFLPQPKWVTGDTGKIGSVHRPMVNLYAHGDAQLRGTRVVGTRLDTPPPIGVWSGGRPPEYEEIGKTVWPATLEIPPSEEASVTFEYSVPDVVVTDHGRSVYRLIVQRQPKIVPEEVSIRVALPDEAGDVETKGFRRDGDAVVWSGPLRKDMILEVSWQG